VRKTEEEMEGKSTTSREMMFEKKSEKDGE
jgi:hypothetical protein